MRLTGTTVRGIRCPIIRAGDNLVQIVTNSILNAAENENFSLHDRDVIAITESIVARAQNNYATLDDIANDIKHKFGPKPINAVGVVFPILSRNRFAMCLKGIARAVEHIILMLSFPNDEVGNELINLDKLDEANIDTDTNFNLNTYRNIFGENKHPFTDIDYVNYYKSIIEEENCECTIIFDNQPKHIFSYTHNVIVANIHNRKRTAKLLKNYYKEANVYTLDQIRTATNNNHGYNSTYGLLGSNKADEERIKLFPNIAPAQELVEQIQQEIFNKTNKHVEVMIYGDGAFKDPVGKIWELADPVVSPAYTSGLNGTPNELKLKYLADSTFNDLNGEELNNAMINAIKQKDNNLKGTMKTEGTTPRQLTDLLGSLCDLTSGSGDKGTPVVLVQGYFDNYAS